MDTFVEASFAIHMCDSEKILNLVHEKGSGFIGIKTNDTPSLLLQAIENKQPTIVDILLKHGADINESFEGKLPILEALDRDYEEIYNILKYRYSGCSNVHQYGWVLMKLLIENKFEKFEDFVNILSVDIEPFFHTLFVGHYPFFLLCGGHNVGAVCYLLDKFTDDCLNIDCRGENSAICRDRVKIAPFKSVLTQEDPQISWTFPTEHVTNMSQEVLWCVENSFVGFNPEHPYHLETYCERADLFREQEYAIIHHLIPHLSSDALAYNGKHRHLYVLHEAYVNKNFDDVSMIEKKLQPVLENVYQISFQYALEFQILDKIRWFIDHMYQLPIHKLHTPLPIPQRLFPSQYNFTPLSTLRNKIKLYDILKHVYTSGKAETNHEMVLGEDEQEEFAWPLIHCEVEAFHTPVTVDYITYQSPLGNLADRYLYSHNEDCGANEISAINAAIQVLYAAGEEFKPTKVQTNYMIHKLPESVKVLKENSKYLQICPYRGPGKEDWLSHQVEDATELTVYTPSLLQITRYLLRKHIRGLNPHVNLFNVYKKLYLDQHINQIIYSELLFGMVGKT